MFKNSYKYLILFFSIFFIFGDKVYVEAEHTAVPDSGSGKVNEFTCMYYEKDKNISWMISQKKDKTIKIYKYSKSGGADISFTDTKWKLEGYNVLRWGDAHGNSDMSLDNSPLVGEEESLTRCPPYFAYEKSTTSYFGYMKYGSVGFELAKKNGRLAEYKKSINKFIEPESKVVNDREPGNYVGKDCPSTTTWVNNNNVYASCLYQQKISYGDGGCHVIQVDIEESGKLTILNDFPTKAGNLTNNVLDIKEKKVNTDILKENFNCKCPPQIYVNNVLNANIKDGGKDKYTHEVYFTTEKVGSQVTTYAYVDAKGKNLCDASMDMDVDFDGFDLNFIDTRDTIVSCKDIIGESGKLVDLLKLLVNLVKFIVPIMIVVLGSLDFVKAIFANDDGNMKKAQAKFFKRVLIGVVVFLAPSILKFVLQIANSIWPIIDADLCGIL